MPAARGLLLGVVALVTMSCTVGGNPVVSGPSAASTSDTPSPTAPQQWTGRIVSRTSHRLYVGGTCASDWTTELRFAIAGTEIRGGATAALTSRGNPCPFPTAQLQIRRFRLRVTGTLDEGRLSVRLREAGSQPTAGADDLGGFRMTTLARILHLRVRHREVSTRVALRAPDGDRGEYDSSNVVHLRCTGC
jgi:hypothetical protein